MKEWLRPYFTAFRLRALLETQYRGAALGGIVTQLAFGLALIFLYQALYASGGDTSVPFSQVVTYVWLQQAFFRALLGSDPALGEAIMTGGIAYELCRPVNTYFYWYLRTLAQKVVGSVMRSIPMFAFAAILPAPLTIGPPHSLISLLLFFLSLTLGFGVISAIANILNAISMRTLDPRGIGNVVQMIFFFLSGNIIPLTLFPKSFQSIIHYQPFAQALDMPIRFYTGSFSYDDILPALCIQVTWLLLLIVVGQIWWRKNLRRVTVQGG